MNNNAGFGGYGYGTDAKTFATNLQRMQVALNTGNMRNMFGGAASAMSMTFQDNTTTVTNEEKSVKKPKSPFEYRVELWNAVNEEIMQVEEFLSKASTKKYKGGLFRVSCFEKNRKGFTVNADYNMELPIGLQEKMIRAAEEYLEELKNQREDMEQGYE